MKKMSTFADFLKVKFDLKCFSEKLAAQIVFQICDALSYLHRNNIIHRDLKPQNIMLRGQMNKDTPNPEICILDFGMSKSSKRWT